MNDKCETYVRESPALGDVTENGLTIFDADIRHQHIAERAYHKAEKRGFESGNELKDWLEAESEIHSLQERWQLASTLGVAI